MEATVGWLLRAVIVLVVHRWAESSLVQEDRPQLDTDVPAVTLCWRTEEFTISRECYNCNQFETKTVGECGVTGFIEEVSCSPSNKVEFKSCRSVAKEKRVFWEFVGIMMAAAVVMSLVVLWRRRKLDWRALEKVRKQIESI
ncbi:PREDICTED: protein JTB [Nanorana parkeri]|uniref:protein JTB n=1 Tax=Nanorana parkeri TaxID=125878 RepID=UPI000854911E|nr:PREDICTED: protein JTB [Nanorana parkeri]